MSAALPRPEAPFVGREAQLVELAKVQQSNRLVTLVGAGGCGKTRLAIEVAGRARDDGQDLAWIDLAPITDASRIDDVMSAGLGLRAAAGASRELILDHLSARPVLLVVDNCEHLVDVAAALLHDIHQRCPLVHILATSREPLALTDEIVWRVPSLEVPMEDTPDALLASEAGRLLVDRIGRVRPGFEPSADEAPALAQICRQLDGIPLALELAAARAGSLSPAAIADRLTDRFSLLTGGGRNVLPRQRTLEASVAWSHQMLDPDEAVALRRLSVFTGSFALAAAVAVVGDGFVGDTGVTDLVLRLVDRSLLQVIDATGAGAGRQPSGREPRFRMLQTIRFFAQERLVDANEAGPIRDAHLRWFEAFAVDAGGRLEGSDARAVVAALEDDLDNVRSAAAWARRRGLGDALVGVVGSLTWFWIWRGRMPEAKEWLAPVDDPGLDVSPHARLQAAWARLQIEVHHTSAHGEIERHSLACLGLARELGDRRAEGRVLVVWGMHQGFRDPRIGLPVVEEGRALCVEHGEPFWAAYGRACLALCHEFLGRYDLAAPHLDAMAVDVRALGNPQLEADHLARQSFVHLLRGDLDAVERIATRVLEVSAGLTDINVSGIARTNAAHAAVARGRAGEALLTTEALYVRYFRDGEYQHLPGILLGTAAALTALGRADEAFDRLRVLAVLPDIQATMPFRLWFRHAMAVAALAMGDQTGATALFTEAVEDAEQCGSSHDVALAERFLAVIDRMEGRHRAAEARLHRALEIHHEHGYPLLVADVIEELAGLEVDHGRAIPAATLYGAAEAIRGRSGSVCRVGRQDAYEADREALARSVAEDDELARAIEAGRSTSLDDIVAFARRGRGMRGRPTFGWDSLTDTEQRVARLAAEGRTNPQIAGDLVMGRETVKSHMSSILRKLGLRNRTELAAAHADRRT